MSFRQYFSSHISLAILLSIASNLVFASRSYSGLCSSKYALPAEDTSSRTDNPSRTNQFSKHPDIQIETPAREAPRSFDLFIASVKEGKYHVAADLIHRGVDVNQASYDGEVALLETIKSGNVEMAQLLICNGAQINTPFEHTAGRYLPLDIDFSFARREASVTPLIVAAALGRSNFLGFLITYGAHVSQTVSYSDENHWDALAAASIAHEAGAVALLLSAGAQRNPKVVRYHYPVIEAGSKLALGQISRELLLQEKATLNEIFCGEQPGRYYIPKDIVNMICSYSSE